MATFSIGFPPRTKSLVDVLCSHLKTNRALDGHKITVPAFPAQDMEIVRGYSLARTVQMFFRHSLKQRTRAEQTRLNSVRDKSGMTCKMAATRFYGGVGSFAMLLREVGLKL